MGKKCLYILVPLFACAGFLYSQGVMPGWDPLTHQTEFRSSGKDSLWILDHRFLLSGSVSIRCDTLRLQPGFDFIVEPVKGHIRFLSPPDSGKVCTVTYQSLPFRLPLTYRHWEESDTVAADTVHAALARVEKPSSSPSAPGADLQKSGSIFRGISIGTQQGMRLQSGLRLQVSGQVAPGVDLVASLTDQNTPIQPEGNTQTLQEIDKVFVNLRTSGFQATLGDFVFQGQSGDLGSYTRKLQGAMGMVEGDWGTVTLAGAASKGQFYTNHFTGNEGNQGPYQLTGAQGERAIIVLAGTERVWIDGETMVRGEENDYTIEYGNGQITFTRNRLVTDDSRITVDFEYSSQKFQKEIYGSTGRFSLFSDRLKLSAALLREADDKDSPLNVALTDSMLDILRNAGDAPDSAVSSGAVYSGSGQGAYVLADTSGTPYYRYVGPQNGDYTVRFSYVGPGKGDYSFQGYGVYTYEGSGKGSYLPLVFLPLATRHQMMDVAGVLDLGGGVELKGELAISEQDLNLYSSRDDSDNLGKAFSGSFRLQDRAIRLRDRSFGKIGLAGRFRRVGDNFRAVGRLTEIEHGRKWGTEEGQTWGENWEEAQVRYLPIDGWEIRLDYGHFRREDGFRSQRQQIETRFQLPRFPRITYQREQIDTEEQGTGGRWMRQQGALQLRLGPFIASMNYMGEDKNRSSTDSLETGFKYDEWNGNLALEKGGVRLEWSETIRDDNRYSGPVLEDYSLAWTHRIQGAWKMGTALSASLMYTHRDRDYVRREMEDQRSDLADLTIRFSPGRRLLSGSFYYRFSSTQISEMVRDTIQVGEGLGNYRYDADLDELVPDPAGDLLVRNVQTGSFLPVNQLKLGGEFRLDGSRWRPGSGGFAGFLGRCRTRTLLRVERGDRSRDFVQVNRSAFSPAWGRDTTVVTGLISLYQDMEYISGKQDVNIRLWLRNDDSENHQLVQQSLVRHLRETAIRVKVNPVRRLGALLEFQNRSEEKLYDERPQSSRDIRGQVWSGELSVRPRQPLEVALKARVRRAKDRFPDPRTEASSVFLMPRISYSVSGKGHIRGEFQWGRIKAWPEDRTLPYEMLSGDQPGETLRWTLLVTYQVTGHVMATLNYQGRREPWRDRLLQTGQVEIRAFF